MRYKYNHIILVIFFISVISVCCKKSDEPKTQAYKKMLGTWTCEKYIVDGNRDNTPDSGDNIEFPAHYYGYMIFTFNDDGTCSLIDKSGPNDIDTLKYNWQLVYNDTYFLLGPPGRNPQSVHIDSLTSNRLVFSDTNASSIVWSYYNK